MFVNTAAYVGARLIAVAEIRLLHDDCAGVCWAPCPLQVPHDAAAHAAQPGAQPQPEVNDQGVAGAAAASRFMMAWLWCSGLLMRSDEWCIGCRQAECWRVQSTAKAAAY
jgi:hypothetical protein